MTPTSGSSVGCVAASRVQDPTNVLQYLKTLNLQLVEEASVNSLPAENGYGGNSSVSTAKSKYFNPHKLFMDTSIALT
jgi:hypothetical protein